MADVRYDVPAVIWSYTANSEAPALLRRIADDIEAADAVLIGLWSTGFGAPNEVVIQVVVDLDDAPGPVSPETTKEH